MRYRFPSCRAPRVRRGFTLIEAAMTTVIIGVGCVSMLALLGAGTMANGSGAELTTAMHLAGNLREAMTGLRYADPTSPTHWGAENGETLASYNDIDDFDAWSSNPYPIDARRNSLGSSYSGWAQQVKVDCVKPDDLQTTTPHLTLPPELRPTCRITVTIVHNNRQVYTQNWIASYSDPSAP